MICIPHIRWTDDPVEFAYVRHILGCDIKSLLGAGGGANESRKEAFLPGKYISEVKRHFSHPKRGLKIVNKSC